MNSAVRGVLLCTVAAATPNAAATSFELRDRLLCPAEILVTLADARKLARIAPDGLRSQGRSQERSTERSLARSDGRSPVRSKGGHPGQTQRGSPAQSEARSRGLRNRISAALATLPLICRRYASASAMDPETEEGFIARTRHLRTLFDSSEWRRFDSSLRELAGAAPFDITSFLLDRDGDRDEREAGEVYRLYCRGCHSAPATDSENPAEPLHEMARTLPPEEFLARMLLGVRGTPDIGLSNPLTTPEIGAMARFLAAGSGPHATSERHDPLPAM